MTKGSQEKKEEKGKKAVIIVVELEDFQRVRELLEKEGIDYWWFPGLFG
jgi:hypothetical protein